MSQKHFDLYDVLQRNARAFANTVALADDNGATLTYGELLDRVDAVGSGLASLGLGRGDRLAILAANSIPFVELLLACGRQGCIAYPINWRLSGEEVERLLERARPKALAFDDDFSNLISEDAWASISRTIALTEDSCQPTATPFDKLGSEAPPAGSSPRDCSLPLDHPFCAIATAAVDVIPRMALLSHGNLIAANLQEIVALDITPEDTNLVALPLFHIAGVGHLLSFLHAAATNLVVPKFDAPTAVDWVENHAVTHLSSFPPVILSLLEAAQDRPEALASLRWVSGLDAPDTMTQLHQQTNATFITGFGQTETSGFVTLQNAREQLGSAGRAGELCTVAIHDDLDRELPNGEVGEIVVRGPLVFLGYDGQEEATEYAFRNGWHHTGDLGRFDEHGVLFYAGRKPEKELIKPGGENVYPAEVETVLREIEGVSEACVFGVLDAKWGEAIKAVLEIPSDVQREQLTLEQVRDFVGERIARYKRPQHVELVESLPRDESGSIDRDAVRANWGD